MESLNEFVLYKSFHRCSFVLVVSSLVTGIILLGVIADIESNEQRYSFSCRKEGPDKEFFQRTCFADYQAKTTRGFPLYGFVLLYFLCVTLVAIGYSLTVRARIEEIESQDQQAIPSNQSCRLYRSYCIQLLIRLTIGMIFLILQWGVFYPLHFPSKHTCDLTHIHQATPQVNATSGNTSGYWYDCYNPQAGTKTFWTILVFTVIALLTFLILLELIYVVIKAKVSDGFKKDFDFFQVYLLNKPRVDRDHEESMPMINITFERYVAELKNNIKEKTKHYETLLPDIPGEEGQSRELDTIYTNLMMYYGRAEYHFSRERYEIVEGYLKSQEQYKSVNELEEIFAPKPGNPPERPLRSIMIIGRPGIGKSLLCQKLLRDWACGESFNEETETGRRFEFVCLFKFRHFRSDETMNLQGLFGRGQFRELPQEAYGWILNNPEQVLLIFDGLDEFDGKENIVKEELRYENKDTENMSFCAMYAKLTLGNLLRGATVVTTSRPTALSCVSFPHHKFDRRLEILGFSYEQIETFVTRFCQDSRDVHGKQIWDHISSSGNLLTLCYIPVSCHILCFALQERLKPGKGNDVKCLPTTLTEIYKDALIIIISKHNPKYRHNVNEQDKLLSSRKFSPKVDESLIRLGKVACAGIEDDRVIFESSEVQGHKESGLIHQLPIVTVGGIQRKEQYCFLHLTLQEFLAAKYIVAQIRKGNPKFESWISGHVRLAGKWEAVMQFVAGLLPDEDNSNVTIFINSLPHPAVSRERWPSQSEEKKLVLRLFKYIFEISKNSNSGWAQLIRNKLSGVVNVDLSDMSLTDADVTSIAFVLQETKNITSLDVGGNFITSIGCKEISHKLLKMLGSSDAHNSNECKLTTLDISGNEIDVEGVKYLSDVLATDECKLTTLDISGNKIGDDGVQHLSDALATDECKLTNLNIAYNNVSDDGLSRFLDAIRKKECRLTVLGIDAKQKPATLLKYFSNECKLTMLNIQGVKVPYDLLKHLPGAFPTLEISADSIYDDGLKPLRDALSSDNCKVTTLKISASRISDDGLKPLRDALSSDKCKVTTLKIRAEYIYIDGLKPLCDALSSDNCKLTTLKISASRIFADGLKPLRDALSSDNCKLTTLKISAEIIYDDGLKPLCDALSSDNCKLTMLNIYFPGIGEHELNQLLHALGTKECKITTTEDSEESEIVDDDVQHSSHKVFSNEHKLTTLNVNAIHLGQY